jgi:hypothetical protein
MAGPIISGGNPRIEAFVCLLLIVLAMVIMVPELTSLVVSKVPWIAPFLYWLRDMMDKRAMRS